MKTKILIASLSIMLLLSGCTKKDESNNQGQTIDSSVVGVDTNEVDVRRDIELSDPNKQVLPGISKDSVPSDEGKNQSDEEKK